MADKAVRNPLWKHLSDAILGILRRHVSLTIATVATILLIALTVRSSKPFCVPPPPTARHCGFLCTPRHVSAQRCDHQRGRSPPALKCTRRQVRKRFSEPANDDVPPELRHDPTNTIHESMDVENILEQVTHDQKRLAFRPTWTAFPSNPTNHVPSPPRLESANERREPGSEKYKHFYRFCRKFKNYKN